VSPIGTEVRVRSIQQHGQPVNRTLAGERCALNLAGVEHAEVGRGNWIVAPASHAPTERIDARIQVLADETHALKHWTPVHLHIGTAAIPARVAIRRGESVAPGHSAVAHLKLDRKVAALHGDRFIIRDHSASRTIGGGYVIDPFAPAVGRNTPARALQLAALDQAEPADALAALLSGSPAGVDIGWFERLFNLTPERIKELLSAAGATVIGKERRVALTATAVKTIEEGLRQTLARFHQEHPQALGAETEFLRMHIAPAFDVATFLALLRAFATERRIEVNGSRVRLPQHISTDNPYDEKIWQTVKPLLDGAGVSVPSVRELAELSRIKETILRDFLHRKSRTGELIRVAPERFFPRATLAHLAATAKDVARTAETGLFTAAQFRDRIGTGRGLAIEILECLDRFAITARVGNARRYVKDFESIPGVAPTSVSTGERIAHSAPGARRRER
jgi:selenocysteine-specific elongation factor